MPKEETALLLSLARPLVFIFCGVMNRVSSQPFLLLINSMELPPTLSTITSLSLKSRSIHPSALFSYYIISILWLLSFFFYLSFFAIIIPTTLFRSLLLPPPPPPPPPEGFPPGICRLNAKPMVRINFKIKNCLGSASILFKLIKYVVRSILFYELLNFITYLFVCAEIMILNLFQCILLNVWSIWVVRVFVD